MNKEAGTRVSNEWGEAGASRFLSGVVIGGWSCDDGSPSRSSPDCY